MSSLLYICKHEALFLYNDVSESVGGTADGLQSQLFVFYSHECVIWLNHLEYFLLK